MSDIVLDGVGKKFPDGAVAVSDVDLEIADGEFVILVGPSGCGKSTTLNMIAGLEDITSGELRIAGERVNEKAPKDRDIAMVFQSYALYPHMTVRENMEFPLRLAKVDRATINSKVEEAAGVLDLTQHLDRKPANLSGGQRQRVAMGRAIVRSPKAFLMDEPLSNLDAKLRVQTRTQIAALQRRLGTTTVYVTHDQVEAMTMGDRVAVLKDGLLLQVDTPRNLYDRPANVFVAGFIGSPAMNLVEVDLTDKGARVGEAVVPLSREVLARLSADGAKTATLGFRPESTEVVGEGEGAFAMEVAVVEELGSDAYAYGNLQLSDSDGPTDQLTIVRVDARKPPMKGETIHLRIRSGEEHLFSNADGARIASDDQPAMTKAGATGASG